ncbi:Tfp pilus assembly protein FimT/FimU [Thermoproteota archaeon]
MKNRGVTLIELLIVTAILVSTIVSLWGTFITSYNCIVNSREFDIAADDLKDVFEKLKNVPFDSISEVFDSAPEIDASSNKIEDGQDAVSADRIGGFLLEGESIAVTYPQITSTVFVSNLPDPLEIEVTITWTAKTGNVRTKTMKTIRTSLL